MVVYVNVYTFATCVTGVDPETYGNDLDTRFRKIKRNWNQPLKELSSQLT